MRKTMKAEGGCRQLQGPAVPRSGPRWAKGRRGAPGGGGQGRALGASSGPPGLQTRRPSDWVEPRAGCGAPLKPGTDDAAALLPP